MYEEFYNLQTKPFGLNPDPHFFFGSKEHKRVLAYMRYGIKQAEGFIVVTGDVGTGKTTLVSTLLEELESNKNVIASQLVTTQLEPDDLLRMVASSFKIPYEGFSKAMLLEKLEIFLRKKAKEKKRVLLIVDEVQNLLPHSLEELRMLSNYQDGARPLLQSFLLGQAEFRDTVRNENLEQFRQRIIASYHLGPLGVDETRGYIEHRLRVAGWHDDPVLTDDAYQGIYKFTCGVPRRINTLCDRLFLYSYLEELHTINNETVNNVITELEEELPYTDKGCSQEDDKGKEYAIDNEVIDKS
ncbi:MAG: XrtA-associated ATPase, partial [Gammaproteobacteria bacterium]|nr:XrtA-associated ATPase [Gammaproteobacteria bacterium]